MRRAAASVALTLAALTAFTAGPAHAFAAPARVPRGAVLSLSADDDVPGVPLPSSPATGSVDALTDGDDVFSLGLDDHDVLEVRLRYEPGDHAASVWLFSPTTASVWGGLPVDSAEGWTTDYFTYEVPAGGGGTYYVDVFGASGTTGYSLEWSVNGAEPISGVERFAGADRYETAVAISRETFTSGSCTSAVLATGEGFADALAASGLAGVLRCPVLLTMTGRLPVDEWDRSIVIQEMRRLGVTEVHVVGGEAAVSPYVLTQLGLRLPEATVTRTAGVTRYETARLIAEEMDARTTGGVGAAFVVPGTAWPDALAASPFAYAGGTPVLLTPPDALDPGVATFLAARCGTVTIVGGALDDGVEAQLAEITSETVTYAGANRYQTATLLAAALAGDGRASDFGYVGLATGDSFADALAGGAAAGRNGGVLLLTPSPHHDSHLHPLTGAALATGMRFGGDVFVFGGESAVGRDAEADVRGILELL